jgi:hypothetical protein
LFVRAPRGIATSLFRMTTIGIALCEDSKHPPGNVVIVGIFIKGIEFIGRIINGASDQRLLRIVDRFKQDRTAVHKSIGDLDTIIFRNLSTQDVE